MMMDAIRDIIQGHDLSETQAEQAISEIMTGQTSDAQIAAFLTGLCIKGEKASEISGGVKALRKFALEIKPATGQCLDIVGTGGDQRGTFNISSAAALVASAAGVPVAKHGNRSVSSRSGSADVFEALGIGIELSPHLASQMLQHHNFTFLFAPIYHPAMKHAAPVRKALGLRTLFNLLGPLANPAKASHMLLGVYADHLRPYMAQALVANGVQSALVVCALDQTDEISLIAPTMISEIKDGQIKEYQLSPEDCGLEYADAGAMQGGNAIQNARLIESVLLGDNKPAGDVIALNAGAALYIAGHSQTITEGVTFAKDLISSGKAYEQLTRLRLAYSQLKHVDKAGEAS